MCEVADLPYRAGEPIIGELISPFRTPVGCPTIVSRKLEVGVVQVHDGLWLDFKAAGFEVALLAVLLVLIPIFSKKLLPRHTVLLKVISLIAGAVVLIAIVAVSLGRISVVGVI